MSDAYLVARHATEHGFLSGFFDPRYLAQFPLAVVQSENRIVAFANLWPSAGREELAVDLLRFAPMAPAGIQEFLLVELMLWARAEGYVWFNLGLAPEADAAEPPAAPTHHHLATYPLASGAEADNPRHIARFQGSIRSGMVAAILGFARRSRPQQRVGSSGVPGGAQPAAQEGRFDFRRGASGRGSRRLGSRPAVFTFPRRR